MPEKEIAAPVTEAANPIHINNFNKNGHQIQAESNFPAPIAQAAFHGVVGDIVKTIAPHTESDPAALLTMTLTTCGAILGRKPYFIADGARHGVNLFICIVGDSGKGRKGTAGARVKSVAIPAADPEFGNRIEKGLSSGEGLINLVRDGTG